MDLRRYVKFYHFNLSNPGLNPTLFPADDDTHYVRTSYGGKTFIHDKGGGQYIIEVNPIDDADGGYLARRFWDLYYNGAKKDEGENIDLGNFKFLAGAQDNDPFEITSDGLAINYSDLYLDWDLYGLSSNIALPSIIPYPAVFVASIWSDCTGIRIHEGSISTSGFTVSRLVGYVENPKVKFLIKGGG